MMRCLVTGATGHLGSFLVRVLLREGCEVAALARESSDFWRIESLIPEMTILMRGASVRPDGDDEAMRIAIGEFAPDVVFHLAWSGIDRESRDAASQIHENVPYALQVFRAAAEGGMRCWIGLGSQAEYGPTSEIMREDLEPHPASAYAVAKHAVALLTEKLCRLGDIRYVWMRLLATYGPSDDERHLIPMLIRKLQAGETPALTSGHQFVDYLYVADAAEALWAAAANQHANGVFNLASGEALRVRELAELVRDVVAPGAELGFGTFRDPQIFDLRADISRLREATGWAPRVALREGIARTAHWYAEQQAVGAGR